MSINVLLVEDEPAFLRRFSEAVRAEPSLSLCGAVTTVAAARALIDANPPDVVLTDLGLPDGHGVEVIRHALARAPGCDVMVVTMFGDDGNVIDSIAAGATGYLMKDAQPEYIAASILEVRAGGSPISPAIARRVLQRFRVGASGVPPLSDRETEILRLVAKGLSFKEVGEVLSRAGTHRPGPAGLHRGHAGPGSHGPGRQRFPGSVEQFQVPVGAPAGNGRRAVHEAGAQSTDLAAAAPWLAVASSMGAWLGHILGAGSQ